MRTNWLARNLGYAWGWLTRQQGWRVRCLLGVLYLLGPYIFRLETKHVGARPVDGPHIRVHWMRKRLVLLLDVLMRPPVWRNGCWEGIERRQLGPVGDVVVSEVLVDPVQREHHLGGNAELRAFGRTQVGDVLIGDDGSGQRRVILGQKIQRGARLSLQLLLVGIAVDSQGVSQA